MICWCSMLMTAFVAYVFTSLFLLKFPLFLHKKKRRSFYCSHISHRGGAAERLENTMPAFRNAQAAACKTDMFELDVHLSKDKKVVVVHDGNLRRVTGVEGKVSDYNYEDLPPLKNRIAVEFANSLHCEHTGTTPQKFPLLEDVFREFPGTPVNIDCKDNDDELIEALAAVVEAFGRESSVAWGNEDSEIVEKLRKKNPAVATIFSKKRLLLLYFWFYTGLLPFMTIEDTFLEIPHIQLLSGLDMELGVPKSLSWLTNWLLSESPTLFAHLRKRGIATYFWVLNDEDGYRRAFELGAEGVMTDCPAKLRRWLDVNPKYEKENLLIDADDLKQKAI